MAARKQPQPPSGVARKKILIVDDHPLMREDLRNTINHEPDMVVCGEVEAAPQAIEAVKKLTPDLALMDVTLQGKSGLELVKDLKVMHPQLLILAVSMHDESLYAERMLRAGASGYVNEQSPPDELIKAIREVCDGRVYVSKEISENLLRRFSGHAQKDPGPLQILTNREFEIFQLIGGGKSPKEIARQLHLSPKTLAVHNANIRQKLALKTFAQLIRFAVRSEDLSHLPPPPPVRDSRRPLG